MTQNQLNHQIARATGETITLIKQIGFELVEVPHAHRARDSRPSRRWPSNQQEPAAVKKADLQLACS